MTYKGEGIRGLRKSYLTLKLSNITTCHVNKKERLPCGKRSWFGGAEEDRTPDLNTASVALSQLSYSPIRPLQPTLCCRGGGEEARTPDLDSAIVALSQLSYTPATLR